MALPFMDFMESWNNGSLALDGNFERNHEK